MTDEFVAAYHSFMAACFQVFVGLGRDAQLKTSAKAQRAERGEAWRDEWSGYFVESENLMTGLDVLKARYQALIDSFAQEFGVFRAARVLSDGADSVRGESRQTQNSPAARARSV